MSNNITKLDFGTPSETAAVPSLKSLVRDEPRGGIVDKDSARALASLDEPALPGVAQANERETYRQHLIAANRALDARQFNTTASGLVAGLAVAMGLVVCGVEGAVVVGLGIGVWKLARFLRRQP